MLRAVLGRTLRLALALAVLGVRVAAAAPVPPTPNGPVTLWLVNARIWTGDPQRPWADSMAVAGERIVAIGPRLEIEKQHPLPRADQAAPPIAGRVLDAGGKLVVPGFIDAHVHMIEGGLRLSSVQLRDVKSRAQLVQRLAAFARTVPPGTWITGGDWDHQAWGGALPDRTWIDAVTPQHPVWISRLDGHMALANTLALRRVGLLEKQPVVAGGTFDRDASGRLTGLLRDNAMDHVERAVAPPAAEQLDQALAAAQRYLAERGVTSVHHMGSWDDLAVLERAWHKARLTTRVYAAVPLATWERLRDRLARTETGQSALPGRPDRPDRDDRWLRIGLLKGFVDGSLGSHTAAFLEPFSDAPGDRGLLVSPPEALLAQIRGADRAGLQVAVHAIGDRANRILLDLFQQVGRDNGPRDRRFRIEHAQHLDPADLPRFGALGVLPSMQPYHAIDDGRWAERVLGPRRIKTTYAFRSLLDAGARLVFGSDWFVAPPSPLLGIDAAVSRRTLDGKHPAGWVPEQRITVEEALRAYTRDAAYAGFEEVDKGTLTPGKLADFVVLDSDLFALPKEQLGEAQVRTTVVGGRVVFERR